LAGTAVIRSANGGAGCGGLYGYTGTHPDQAHGVFVGLLALVECSAGDEGGVDVADGATGGNGRPRLRDLLDDVASIHRYSDVRAFTSQAPSPVPDPGQLATSAVVR